MNEEEQENLNHPQTVLDIISGSLENSLPEHLVADVRDHLGTVYGCAVAHALRDLEIISGAGGFGEEDRTASLIGHLGWYLALSDLSGSGKEQPSVSWSYQSKKAEAEKGGDFGLVVRLDGDKYNIAFFQAKNADLASRKAVNLWRPPSSYHHSSEDMSDEQALDAANNELFSAISGKPLSAQSGKGQHQFVKLAVIAAKATNKIGSKSSWIHYVLWPKNPSGAPRVLDLPILRTILQKPGAVSKAALNVPAAEYENAGTFASLLMRGTTSGAAGWLTLSREQARDLIGDLTELCNRWMIVEERGSIGGLVNALRNHDTRVVETHRPLENVPRLEPQTPSISSGSTTKPSRRR
jgi:hypothetical protein